MIKENVKRLLASIPEDVIFVAAAKTRTKEEVESAYSAGIRYFGHNYVQEAQAMIPFLDIEVQWHMIGHLQRNKVKDALQMFDLFETLDSVRLAQEFEKRAAQANKTVKVLIEINSGKEDSKSGILPKDVDGLIQAVAGMEHVKVEGLMTMGPFTGDPELSRPYFVKTRRIFERLKGYPSANINMRFLSMGMSNSYQVAIQEGANIIRIGTLIFGERH